MSVTFSAELGDVLGFIVTCSCPGAREYATEHGPLYTVHTDAETAVIAAKATITEHGQRKADPGCEHEWCAYETPFMRSVEGEEEGPSVNISNTNAQFVLDAMGLDTDELSGCMSGRRFAECITLAFAFNPGDEGVPAHEVGEPGGMSVIDCGRSAGYLERTLGSLWELAQWCQRKERNVSWA